MSARRPRRGPHPRTRGPAGRRAAAPGRRGPGRADLRPAGLSGHHPGRLGGQRDPARGRGPGGGCPGGRRRHGRLADHRDRAGRRPGRGHRGRGPGPDTGRPPGRHRRVTRPARPRGQQPRPDSRPEPGARATQGRGRRDNTRPAEETICLQHPGPRQSPGATWRSPVPWLTAAGRSGPSTENPHLCADGRRRSLPLEGTYRRFRRCGDDHRSSLCAHGAPCLSSHRCGPG